MLNRQDRPCTWHGGVVRAPYYASHGRYRPDIAAWICDPGILIAARLIPPGEGPAALGQVLVDALAAWKGLQPACLTVETERERHAISGCSPLPVRQWPHWGFSIIIEDHLDQIGGLGFEQGYVEQGVTVELARELFLTSNEALSRLPMEIDRPVLCAIRMPSVAPDPVTAWIGFEPVVVGKGLRFFRDLAAYRDHMRINLILDCIWEDDDDQSMLGLGSIAVKELNPSQQRDIRRHRLPVARPGLAPVVVAVDEDGVHRPYNDGDVRDIILLTRAVCAAHVVGIEESSLTVDLLGEPHPATVWLRHPDATLDDLALTCDPERGHR